MSAFFGYGKATVIEGVMVCRMVQCVRYGSKGGFGYGSV